MLLLCSIAIPILLFVSEIKHVPLVWYGDVYSRSAQQNLYIHEIAEWDTTTLMYSDTDMLEPLASLFEVFSSYPSVEKQRKTAILMHAFTIFP